MLAMGCHLKRPCRAEGALSMRAPEDVGRNQSFRAGETFTVARGALNGPGSPIVRSSHASQPSPQHP